MPRKALSQNFLFDPSILGRIIETAGVGPDDTVVEIGPGPGRLTRMLAERAGRVLAIEVDRELYARLKAGMGDRENLTLILGDALRFPYERIGEPFKVVANIPYHITTPIIFRLLEHRTLLRSMTLTVQKEVARRAAAAPGGRDYGVLSLMLQYRGEVRVPFTIPRGAFRPVPKVDSACLHIRIHGKPPVEVPSEELFFSLVRTSFGQRRKSIQNSLQRDFPGIGEALRRAGIERMRRPETLSLEDFARLSRELAASRGDEPA
ncbi:MAG: 16S rRNA (adenine(1518)-N(6)/adenine(1519)-N(6))-dimethyltransferase RsmA [Nitrospirota bacterium]|jgi:16S rRNA (adenine1518-N6/adenine1519-N6)-dimethyltransferase